MKTIKKQANQYEKYYSRINRTIATSQYGVLEKKEISLRFHYISPRLVGYILKEMKDNGILYNKRKQLLKQDKEYDSQQGKKGYAVNERAIEEAFFTKTILKTGKQVFTNLTQTQLGKRIREWKVIFKKQVRDKKSIYNQDNATIIWTNMQAMSICTSWVAKLTLMIQGDFFKEDERKKDLALGNISLLDDMIKYFSDNIKEKFPKMHKRSMIQIMSHFEFVDPFAGTEFDRNFAFFRNLLKK